MRLSNECEMNLSSFPRVKFEIALTYILVVGTSQYSVHSTPYEPFLAVISLWVPRSMSIAPGDGSSDEEAKP